MAKALSGLKRYNELIREAWLPLVGRKKLTSHESRLIKQWLGDDIPVEAVLKAIDQCARRARSNRTPLYSLGIVRGDLAGVLKQRAQMAIGEKAETTGWRERMTADLEELKSLDPDRAGIYEELQRALPGIATEREAQARWMQLRG